MATSTEGGADDAISFTVKFCGRSIPVTTSCSSTVRDFKTLLQPFTDVPSRGQKLIFKGKVLADASTLKASGLMNGAKVILMASQGLHQGKLLMTANGISEQSVSWEGLSSLRLLTVLSLSQNHFKSLPSAASVLRSLRQLDMSCNQLTALPVEIGHLKQLEVEETISTIAPSIGDCNSLLEVDFSSNLLSELPKTMGNLHNLKVLILGNNGLISLPSSLFRGCIHLSMLALHNTEITTDILHQIEGWESFDERRRLKHQKQLDFRVVSSAEFDEAKQLAAGSETIEDLRRLALIFGNVDRLLHLVDFLHRKFFLARSLSDAIFSGFFKHSTRRMGTCSMEGVDEADFDMKIPVKNHERQVISDMFAPPTVNQSWRKVQSMGNLLNGHEPVLRENIFQT